MDDNQETTKSIKAFQSNKAQSVGGPTRRRGHQHHIRHLGTRASNIEANEILAALRKGDQMPITEPFQQYCEQPIHHHDIGVNLDDSFIDGKQMQSFHSNNTFDPCTQADHNGNRNSSRNKNNDDCVGNNTIGLMSVSTDQFTGSLGNESNSIIINDNDIDIVTQSTLKSVALDQLDTVKDMEITLTDIGNVPINNSSNNSKSKSKRLKKTHSILLDAETDANRETHGRKLIHLPPVEERPPLEGADADYWTEMNSTDIENDPEAAEWSKLRCTSERTEVIAEREYRRQNRRCADYPGLAFGRSIFSSDTMMKLNIIRNELHNIMKTQLKRVRVMDVDTMPCTAYDIAHDQFFSEQRFSVSTSLLQLLLHFIHAIFASYVFIFLPIE